MHDEARHFVQWASESLCEFFAEGTRALDLGSVDINGCNKSLFKGEYTGIDIAPGNNVDIVCKASEAPFEDMTFDTIISTECLEHDKYYSDSLTKAYNLLRRGGLLIFTCATTGRWEHGTARTSPEDSLTSRLTDSSWANYYKNLTAEDICNVFEEHGVRMDDIFFDYAFYENAESHDLYFVAVKRSENTSFLPRYEAPHVKMVCAPKNRAIAYVLCRSMDDIENAAEFYRECNWARLVFMPTTFYGRHVAYFHILPSRADEWIHADYVGVVPWGSQSVDVADMDGLIDRCKKDNADVIAFKADLEDVVATTGENHPEFLKLWTWLLENSGYKGPDITDPKMLHFKGAWLCKPTWMSKYCDFFKEARHVMDMAPFDMQSSLWSASGVDDPLMTDDDKMRAWGTIHEPYHRLLASKLAGFFFWVKRASVAST